MFFINMIILFFFIAFLINILTNILTDPSILFDIFEEFANGKWKENFSKVFKNVFPN